jgi:hypothetical protein
VQLVRMTHLQTLVSSMPCIFSCHLETVVVTGRPIAFPRLRKKVYKTKFHKSLHKSNSQKRLTERQTFSCCIGQLSSCMCRLLANIGACSSFFHYQSLSTLGIHLFMNRRDTKSAEPHPVLAIFSKFKYLVYSWNALKFRILF